MHHINRAVTLNVTFTLLAHKVKVSNEILFMRQRLEYDAGISRSEQGNRTMSAEAK